MNREQTVVIHRVEEYIEAHLTEPITLMGIARAVGYSPSYLSRLYRTARGRTLFSHIRRRRLTRAAQNLRSDDRRIIDTAMDFLFSSHAGFTRSFVRQFGIAPKRWKEGCATRTPFQDVLLNRNERGMNEMKDADAIELMPVFVQIMKKPERKVLLKRAETATHYMTYCEETGCDVWEELSGFTRALGEPMGFWLPEPMVPDGTSPYVMGVEFALDEPVEVPEGYELVTMPAVDMMLFQGPAFPDDAFEEAIDNLWRFIDAFDPLIYGYRWAKEKGPRFQYIPEGYRGYIEGLAVERIGD